MFRITTWWPFARLAAAALGLVAIFTQLVVSLVSASQQTAPWASHLPTVAANYFSFFTILSNLSAAAMLISGAIWALTKGRRADRQPRWLAVGLACTATYMIVTGLVFNLYLRGIPLPIGATRPWTSEVLHVVLPLFIVADLVFAPKRRRLSWSTLIPITAFPIVWAVYSMLRAHTVTSTTTGEPYWYPYPFLNPMITPGGALGVAGFIAGISLLFIAIGSAVIWRSRLRPLRTTLDTSRASADAHLDTPTRGAATR